MKAFHVICGLPRSGSTLLCNILAQNPAFHVLHTSPLPTLLDHFCQGVTNVPEIKGMLQRDPKGTDAAIWAMARGIVEGLHPAAKTCFDKNRFWNAQRGVLARLYPDAKFIACVRDLRGVFGSLEKQWARNPLVQIPPGYTARARMQNAFGPEGMIGSALAGLEDLTTSAPPAFFMPYEALCQNPEVSLQNLYQHLGEPWYEHDLTKIRSTAVDPDWLYLGKFPHDGTGKVKAREDWQAHVPRNLADEIMAAHASYNQTFGYA